MAAYVLGSDEGRLLALLSTVLGPLTADGGGEGFHFHAFDGGIVVLLPDDNGVFDVWVKGSDAWSSNPAFGRFLAAGLDSTVRCDPGAEAPEVSPFSSAFLEIDRDGERLVTWE